MLPLMLVLICAVPSPALADPPFEDAEHRADRLRTEQLNRDAGAAARRRDRAAAAARDRGYAAARARYEARMAEWRRQVAACRDGDYSACDR